MHVNSFPLRTGQIAHKICFTAKPTLIAVTTGRGVVEAKIRVETRRALTCDDQTVGSVAHACTDTRGDKLITT